MRFTAREWLLFPSMLLVVSGVTQAQEPPMMAVSPMNIEFMSAPISFDIEPVIGAPYSAEAVTEVVQTLADGNRIVRESRAQINRDGKGRTRREQGLAMFGPLVGGPAGGDEPRHVQISDPATKMTIMLDLQHRFAHKMPAPQVRVMPKIADHFEIALPPPPPPPPPPPGAPEAGVRIFRGWNADAMAGVAAGFGRAGSDSTNHVEHLGTQFIEGVTVEGTRTTVTIPAAQIGNELPIKIVSERWFSPDLKVLVMSRQSDPRFGETTYRLTNLTRGEPAADLFEAPADFKMFEPGKNRDVVIEKRIINR